ncbi:MAG: hypothetical protein KDA94_13740 [Acidimicrobiales bacterium]|nr:hypothetical protein [Acidimicrobiales bacterium]
MGDGSRSMTWPDGKRFAFTIFDDTDMTTLANGPAVYEVLDRLGLRITKSVWPVAPEGPPRTGGATCADPDYLAWVLELQAAGHEIGYHNASDHPSKRGATIAALDRFAELFGHDPRIGADHAGNLEAMYWGPSRLTGPRSWLYERATKLTRPDRPSASGHDPTSEHFWGDVLQRRVDYWRNFTFHQTDTLAACPQLPYHDPARPFVNWWFASSHAPKLEPYLQLLAPGRLDALERSGGACIVYTHFGVDFARDGKVDPRFVAVMEDLASRDAWCAPTSEVLDHIRAQRGDDVPLTGRQRSRLENRWIVDQARHRARTEASRAIARRRR